MIQLSMHPLGPFLQFLQGPLVSLSMQTPSECMPPTSPSASTTWVGVAVAAACIWGTHSEHIWLGVAALAAPLKVSAASMMQQKPEGVGLCARLF